jgi:MoaA/NifB/PqqE/SkfB family radical SAM enzyme
MDGSLFKKLIDEIEAENSEAVVLPFWRGESCMHPEFASLLNYALDKGARIHLSTNGHYIDLDFVNIFYRCEFVTFSLHDKHGYENAQRVAERKPTDCRTTFQISFVDSETSTKKYLRECTSDAHLKGFDSVRLYEEHTIGGKYGKSKGRSLSERMCCPKLTHTFVVDADGQFSRCNHIWETETVLNLADVTIREAWESLRMVEIRSRYPDERCASCDQWSGHTNGQGWHKDVHGLVEHIFYSVS